MNPQLVVDLGGRVMSALLITADGQLVPCSQDIRQTAARHVSTSVLYEPRLTEDPDFLWDEALEVLSRAAPHNFFQRARRIGLRRPWDAHAPAGALQLASPLAVLSSPAALADETGAAMLPRMSFALLDALLEPIFSFAANRPLSLDTVEPYVIVPARAGRRARLLLQKLFRRRGLRPLTVVRRELAIALTSVEEPCTETIVVDASENDLHLHRVAFGGDDGERRVRTAATATVRGLGWTSWLARVAVALQTTPSSSFDRALTSLLSGSPESVETRVTHGALQNVLDARWVEEHRSEISARLREPLASIGGTDLPCLFAGEIFAVEAIRQLFGDTSTADAPVLDRATHGLARALLWLRGHATRRLVLETEGSLRVETRQGQTVDLVPHAQLPRPGDACHVERSFRFGGDANAGQSFLVHLLWGTDRAAEGNATLVAAPLDLRGARGDELRVVADVRRTRGGSRIHGCVEARLPRDGAAVRMHFAEELEVRK